MRFKDFINEDLQGLFGKVKTTNPVAVDHFKDKKFFVPPNAKPKGKSSVKSMTDGEKALTTAVMPSTSIPSSKKQHTIRNPSKQPYFKPAKTKRVKSPLGFS